MYNALLGMKCVKGQQGEIPIPGRSLEEKEVAVVTRSKSSKVKDVFDDGDLSDAFKVKEVVRQSEDSSRDKTDC